MANETKISKPKTDSVGNAKRRNALNLKVAIFWIFIWVACIFLKEENFLNEKSFVAITHEIDN